MPSLAPSREVDQKSEDAEHSPEVEPEEEDVVGQKANSKDDNEGQHSNSHFATGTNLKKMQHKHQHGLIGNGKRIAMPAVSTHLT